MAESKARNISGNFSATGAPVSVSADASIAATQIGSGTISDARLPTTLATKTLTTATISSLAAAVPGKTQTATISSNTVLDFATYQNFILTLGGSLQLSNQSGDISAQAGQSGFIIFIQDGTGSRVVSTASDFTAAGGSLTLSTDASAIDIVPYVIQADNKILLGTPQLAFAAVS